MRRRDLGAACLALGLSLTACGTTAPEDSASTPVQQDVADGTPSAGVPDEQDVTTGPGGQQAPGDEEDTTAGTDSPGPTEGSPDETSDATGTAGPDDEGPADTAGPDDEAGPTGPLPDGRASACAEPYSPDAVGHRAFAFDGVVEEVGPSVSNQGDGGDLDYAGVTFEVVEWLVGGEGDTVTVDVQSPDAAGAGPDQDGPAYEVGTRLLVSGEPRWGGAPLDAPIAWGCGFTRYHDEESADAWRESLAP